MCVGCWACVGRLAGDVFTAAGVRRCRIPTAGRERGEHLGGGGAWQGTEEAGRGTSLMMRRACGQCRCQQVASWQCNSPVQCVSSAWLDLQWSPCSAANSPSRLSADSRAVHPAVLHISQPACLWASGGRRDKAGQGCVGRTCSNEAYLAAARAAEHAQHTQQKVCAGEHNIWQCEGRGTGVVMLMWRTVCEDMQL